jgi:hypothetical protein
MSRSRQYVGGSTTRREFLRAGAVAGLALAGGTWKSAGGAAATRPAMRPGDVVFRPDLLDESSPTGLEIIQLTTDPEVPSSHVYMEAQIFTPDSKRFVLHRSAHAHGSDRKDPRHQYLLCDIDDSFALHPLTHEIGTTGPSISPDGKCLYYFVDETRRGGQGRLTLKRVNLDGTDRQTLFVVDTPLPGTNFRPSRVYPLSTISSDGKRLAISACLGDGETTPAPYGLMLFDLERATAGVVIHGANWVNMHPQYSRSHDPEHMRDILLQENHEWQADASGQVIRGRGDGADIHVIRDDGTNFRDMPWGRDGDEFCQGHQCWRGRSEWAITSTVMRTTTACRLIESLPVPHAGHIGLKSPGGIRNELSRDFPQPRFYHFATDIAGRWLVSDGAIFEPETGRVYLARFGEPGRDPLTAWVCLARPLTSGKKESHIHPFLSPDGRMAFFNSDESGLLQAYMIRGVPA